MKVMLKLLLLIPLCVASAAAATDTVATRVELDSIEQRVQPCMACHGAEGRATSDGYYPRIAGKPAGYLYHQLLHFREGRRQYPMMSYLVERQSEAYLREMADYFANQHLPYAPPQQPSVDAAVLERGRRLVLDGDPQRELPSCRACHGERLTGTQPAIPGLLGLSHDYLLAQLGAWRLNQRRAHAPDCMAQIVDKLKDDELYAAAAWLATQPLPADTTPAAMPAVALPIACGSAGAGR